MNLVECPRDAMQGWPTFIETADKIAYINALMRVGFSAIDFGSFVSSSVVPQMRDTETVIEGLDPSWTARNRLLAIVASFKGAQRALAFQDIAHIGFPLSISEKFQLSNTKKNIETSLELVKEIQAECEKKDRELVVYISMAFGNPYGELYDETLTTSLAGKIAALGVRRLYLADTTGVASPAQITSLFKRCSEELPDVTVGLHLHAHPGNVSSIISAAIDAGCSLLDSTLGGIGGCPFAEHNLTGNIPTERVIDQLAGVDLALDLSALRDAEVIRDRLFVN